MWAWAKEVGRCLCHLVDCVERALGARQGLHASHPRSHSRRLLLADTGAAPVPSLAPAGLAPASLRPASLRPADALIAAPSGQSTGRVE